MFEVFSTGDRSISWLGSCTVIKKNGNGVKRGAWIESINSAMDKREMTTTKQINKNKHKQQQKKQQRKKKTTLYRNQSLSNTSLLKLTTVVN